MSQLLLHMQPSTIDCYGQCLTGLLRDVQHCRGRNLNYFQQMFAKTADNKQKCVTIDSFWLSLKNDSSQQKMTYFLHAFLSIAVLFERRRKKG